MSSKKRTIHTTCVHAGELKDPIYGGATAPIYTSTAYDYRGEGTNLYPRYMNTPNQVALAQKMAALEHTEAGLIFASGMAAISAVFMTFLKTGDHIILQESIYGGTSHFVTAEFEKTGIEYTFLADMSVDHLEEHTTDRTKMIYIETPSNPLLKITDVAAVSAFAKARSIITSIDNTFASPVNQNPADHGIDKVNYPGLKSHPDHKIAKKQMHGYGGMLSFELDATIDHEDFVAHLKTIKVALSLAGVESTILEPAVTSHSLLTEKQRTEQGISNSLLRFSVGIEEVSVLKNDIQQAIEKSRKLDS